jgi:hypothetical protein
MVKRSFKSNFLKWASLFSGKHFAMLAVYSDETGTGGVPESGQEPAPGVYGFITTPEKWDEFRITWKASLDKCKAPYFHFRELHAKNRRKENNPFHTWTNDEVDDFIYEMAIVASSGPIPFGGNVSQKKTVGANPDKFSQAWLYRQMFYQFFGDFKLTMDDHFKDETEKVSFFFSENNNENWIKILSQVIKDVRHHNPIIGEYSFMEPKTERGMPCQAADLFAYVNRQNSSKMYEEDRARSMRLLDLMIGRQILGKAYWFMRPLIELPENEWRELVADMRKQKKEFDLKKENKDDYYKPIRQHPYFAKIAKK